MSDVNFGMKQEEKDNENRNQLKIFDVSQPIKGVKEKEAIKFEDKSRSSNTKKLSELKEKNKTLLNQIILGNRNLSELRLRYSFCQEMVYLICCHRSCYRKDVKLKEVQYEKCIEHVREQMNFNVIIRKLHEIDYLKAILFNKEQIISFLYFHRPMIDFKNKNQERIS